MFGLNPTLIIGVVIAFVVSNGISYGVGHHNGYEGEHTKFMAFEAQVKAEGEAAIKHNKQVVADQTAITKQTADDYEAKITKIHTAYAVVQDATVKATTQGVSSDYETKIASLHKYYGAAVDSVFHAGSSGSRVSSVPAATCSVNAAPSDAGLAERCAVTTQQLVSLQGWIRANAAIK